MSIIMDVHSHVLPGIDDGSTSVQESLAMLRKEVSQKIRYVVATPHFYADHDNPVNFLHRRRESVLRLQDAMDKEEGPLPHLLIGAEVHYYHGMSESAILEKMRIGHSRYLLVEMPMGPWTDPMYKELEDIYRKQEMIPIVAHIDRYIGLFRTHGIPERLEELPVLVQANASFFLRRWTAGMAVRMLKKGQIHVLGSDCHNMQVRPPRLGDAIEAIRHRAGRSVLREVHGNEKLLLTR